MKVYQRLAQAFQAEGVTATFGMMGDGNMFWVSELHKLGIKVHEVRHEGAGLGMADGWARITRTPGVATATCGPGVTQFATGLVTAARARSPIVVFCGEHPTTDDEYIQHFDQARFAAACEAGFVRLSSPEATDEVVRKAFQMAKMESRPVMLSCPMDLQQKPFEDDEPYRPTGELFARGMVHPDPRALEQAAEMIAAAERPVIIVGRGAEWSGAGEAILRMGTVMRPLLVADLHLEKGTSLARRGVHLPPYDSRESLEQLRRVIAAAKPQRLIFLGDSFHDPAARERIVRIAKDRVCRVGSHQRPPPRTGSVVLAGALGASVPAGLLFAVNDLSAGGAPVGGSTAPW
jgi:TPP-dependent 2-oxoacid decarboxylase